MNPMDKKAETPNKAVMQAGMSKMGSMKPTPKSGSHVAPNPGASAPTGGATADKGGKHHLRIHDLRHAGSGFVVTHHDMPEGQPTHIHAIEDVKGLRKHLADHYGEDAMMADPNQSTPKPKDDEKASPADRKEKKGAVSE